jgi:hypothetical protein
VYPSHVGLGNETSSTWQFDLIQQLLGRDLTDAFARIVQGATRT